MWRDVARRELRTHLRAVLAWWIPVAGLLVLVCAMQPSLAAGLLQAKVQAMPEAMRRAFGMELADFSRPAIYLATNFLYVTLTVALLASRLGAAAVAREEVLHTAELLYAQPITRTRVLAGKAAAIGLYVIAFPIALFAVSAPALGAAVQRPLEPALVLALFAGAAALGVCFAGLGMLVATLVRDARSASGAALGLALGTWFCGIVAAISPQAAALRWLSPYELLPPARIVAAGGLDPVRAGALLAVGLAAAVLAIARYRRRDLHA